MPINHQGVIALHTNRSFGLRTATLSCSPPVHKLEIPSLRILSSQFHIPSTMHLSFAAIFVLVISTGAAISTAVPLRNSSLYPTFLYPKLTALRTPMNANPRLPPASWVMTDGNHLSL